MEREILWTGIGGQGVQLAAQVFARAAVNEGREVMMLGTYGGTMRGGNTDSTLVVADGPISCPPIVSKSWSAVAMHHQFWEPVRAKLRPGGLVVVDETVFEGDVDREAQQVFAVPATRMATELGSPLAASMVLTGAFASLTGFVALESLVVAMRESVPSYRTEHIENNERALRAGAEAAPRDVAPAWPGGGAS